MVKYSVGRRLLFCAALAFCLILLFSCPFTEYVSEQNGNTLRASVKLQNCTAQIFVTYGPGRRAWAEYQLFQSMYFFKAAENYLNSPLPYNFDLLFLGTSQAQDDGTPVGGINTRECVALSYDSTRINDPTTVLHEITHYWFGSSSDYIDEGIAGFFPLLCSLENQISLTAIEESCLYSHNYFFNETPPGGLDQALPAEFWTDQTYTSFFYHKAFKLHYLLYRELGVAGYRTFLTRLIANHSVQDVSTVINILDGIKPAVNWNMFLTGWLIDGSYQPGIALSDFRDQDVDGLADIDEVRYLGLGTSHLNPDTDTDGIPDGVEYAEGFNPNNPASPPGAAAYITANAPFVDGTYTAGEWTSFGYSTATDPNDATPNEYDILNIRFTKRGERFCLAAETEATPLISNANYYAVYFDTNNDGTTDFYLYYILDQIRDVYAYYRSGSDYVRLPYAIDAKIRFNSIFEASCPLSDIGATNFRFYVRTGVRNGSVIDSTGWITVP